MWLITSVIKSEVRSFTTQITTTTSIYPRLTFNDTELNELYAKLAELDKTIIYCYQKDEYSYMKTALHSIEHYNAILTILIMEIEKNRTNEDVQLFADTMVDIESPQFIRICPERNISSLKFNPTMETLNEFKYLYNETKTLFRSILEKL